MTSSLVSDEPYAVRCMTIFVRSLGDQTPTLWRDIATSPARQPIT